MTARSVIGAALRKSGSVPLHGVPTVDQLDAGIAALRDLLLAWATGGAFGSLGVSCASPADLPSYGPDLTLIRTTEDPSGTYLYDAYGDAWWDLNAVTLDDVAPLETRGADGLACCLAQQLADDLTAPLAAQTHQGAQNFRTMIATKPGFVRPTVCVDYF